MTELLAIASDAEIAAMLKIKRRQVYNCRRRGFTRGQQYELALKVQGLEVDEEHRPKAAELAMARVLHQRVAAQRENAA